MSSLRSTSQAQVIFAALTVIIAVAGTLLFGELVCRMLMPQWREFLSERFIVQRSIPGYMTVLTGRPGFDAYFSQNNGDFRVRIVINAAGHRSPRPPAAASNALWAIGDSFTFGWGVEIRDSFAKVAATAAGFPIYNLASPGADVCGYRTQRAAMPPEARPRAVVVGLTLENDVHDYDCPAQFSQGAVLPKGASSAWPSLSEVKQLLMARSALYNFVAVSLKRAPLVEGWLKRIGLVAREHDYRRGFELSDIAKRAERTAAELLELKDSFGFGTPFVVLVIPARFELLTQDVFYAALRQQILAELAARRIDVIDPYRELLAAGFTATHFPHDGHWSEGGHRIAGVMLAAWLRARISG